MHYDPTWDRTAQSRRLTTFYTFVTQLIYFTRVLTELTFFITLKFELPDIISDPYSSPDYVVYLNRRLKNFNAFIIYFNCFKYNDITQKLLVCIFSSYLQLSAYFNISLTTVGMFRNKLKAAYKIFYNCFIGNSFSLYIRQLFIIKI